MAIIEKEEVVFERFIFSSNMLYRTPYVTSLGNNFICISIVEGGTKVNSGFYFIAIGPQ
jgi:hypothetical protein